ncbi:MlaD family protein [Nitrospirillum sp. BR 11752]|uniref:PqiB family protein n=1 Tax=Nitrospirillum sp. BR 11752 TaxID=3104293 RepID=UPI002EA2ADD7|nr:MlaD family protein [Nitrospirillum sp. BR 11752]
MTAPIPSATAARRHLPPKSWIWLAPLAAVVILAVLGYRAWVDRGPLATVEFSNAEGLVPGQSLVRHRSIPVGTVVAMRLAPDLSKVRVTLRLAPQLTDRLKEGAHFWVVRPRLGPGGISGIETIVAGAYVEFDPGPRDGKPVPTFTGLDEPPPVREGEPGRSFTLLATRLGALRPGSVLLFRDVPAGEVQSIDPPGSSGDITVHIFVRAPFDTYVRTSSRFWSSSGISASFGPGGLKLELASLSAVLGGGIAFETPADRLNAPPATSATSFRLYDSPEEASAAQTRRLEVLTYLGGSAAGLSIGSPVELHGIRIGSVTAVDLAYDAAADHFSVPVRMALEPGRITAGTSLSTEDLGPALARLVARGYRLRLRNANLLTGQKALALDPMPDTPPATMYLERGVPVLPAVIGDGDLTQAIGTLAGRLERLPLDEMGRNLNAVLVSLNGVIGGPELQGVLVRLSDTLAQAQTLLRTADGNLSPALRQLPAIAATLDQTLQRADALLAAADRGYGGDSPFNRQASHALRDVSDAARAIRQLADALERHPEALVRGKP